MFKVSGFDLPKTIEKDAPKKGKSQGNQDNKKQKPSADGLQELFGQLGRNEAEPKRKINAVQDEAEVETPMPQKQKAADQKLKPKKKQKLENKKSEQLKPEKLSKAKPTENRPSAPASVASSTKLTPMQLKMQQKLSGARFRWINEQLYTTSSSEALDLFNKQPHVFGEYHEGFKHQVESWPENPVDTMVKNFKLRLQKPLNAPGGLPADYSGEVVVADMGCGEAKLALQVSKLRGGPKSRRAHFKVHSFDLHKANDRITVADMANVPLPDSSVHVVVFCLALMGTNLKDFITEALRILKPQGEIWVAEIKSRFDITERGTDVSRFVETLKGFGLHHKATDETNKMFVRFEFVFFPRDERKKFIEPKEDERPLLKPCIYKRR